MRQLNFLLFFALCLALALFSIENTQPVAINIIPGIQAEAPLSIELLLAVGTGAILAWIFSLWDQLQRQIESWKAQRELKLQSQKIEELEKTLAELQAAPENEIESVSERVSEPIAEVRADVASSEEIDALAPGAESPSSPTLTNEPEKIAAEGLSS
ncbi:lipopolysaccharide assembly protein LapA domain-containing protein [Picosynechococcus sp. NKBG15041c]|uniref:lipopolysaccharide assembly protein LapA domain-containing protein n=1 Tax=Picosynechococcus sp. NKBG15041c TaxID=1407650 RepID=UPI0004226A72|nr:lipopolysaccharide assembly protein LapA domain-containing protein [Picosynechococcus sp. NKBG15041c]